MTKRRRNRTAVTRPLIVLALLLSTTHCGSSAPAEPSDPNAPDAPTPGVPAGPSAGPAARLVFQAQPATAIAGSPQIINVRVEDVIGRVVTSPTAVRIGFGANPVGATLFGSLRQTSVAGIATFSDLVIRKAAQGYRLAATFDDGNPNALSTTFSIIAAAPVRGWIDPETALLSFPEGSITVRLTPHLVDVYDNEVPTSWTWSSSAPAAATVNAEGLVTGNGGTATIHAISGNRHLTAEITTFCTPARCSGTTSPSLTTPASARAGTVLPPVTYSLGAFGSCRSTTLTLRLGANPTGAKLTGNPDKPCSNSVTWSTLSIDRPGTYTLIVGYETTAPFLVTP
jgi:hypothetical protein